MKNSSWIYITVIIFATAQFGFSQKYLVKKDMTVLKVEIIEVNEENISYKHLDGYVDLTYITPNSEIAFIDDHKYPEGLINNPDIFAYNQTVNLKLGLSSLGNNTVYFGVEKSLSPRTSLEIGLKIHNKTSDDFLFEEYSGWGANIGYKYRLKNPYSISKKNKVTHILGGPYIRTLLGFSDRTEIRLMNKDEYKIAYAGLQLGYQLTYKNIVTIDAYAGGFGFTGEGTSTPESNSFTIPIKIELEEGDLYGKNNLGYSVGVRFGVLIK